MLYSTHKTTAQTNFSDVDECVQAAINGTAICTGSMLCVNLNGGYKCECPEGTLLINSTCIGRFFTFCSSKLFFLENDIKQHTCIKINDGLFSNL